MTGLGHLGAELLGLAEAQRRTVLVEVGIQNFDMPMGLALMIATPMSLGASGQAATVFGVTMPEQVELGGRRLALNGMAVCRVPFFDMYLAGQIGSKNGGHTGARLLRLLMTVRFRRRCRTLAHPSALCPNRMRGSMLPVTPARGGRRLEMTP